MRTIALSAPVIGFLAYAGWYRRWMSDDGFIYLRVVQNLLAGHGPVFNAGERVEAATGPAWTAVLALAGWTTPIRLEWLAVGLGIAATTAGAVAATATAWRIQHVGLREEGTLWPLGLVVFAAIPVVWDYETSGLETGLIYAWLGLTAYAIARYLTRAPSSNTSIPRGAAVLAGLGPLLRPDAALFSIAFVAALVIVQTGDRAWRRRVRVLAFASVIPLAYEVFRAGYYAALVPNTAFAKEGSIPRIHQGLRYALDFERSYLLVVPAGLLALALVLLVVRLRREHDGLFVLSVGIGVAGLADAAYAIYCGGSHMHGRLFLPCVFAMTIPVAVLPARGVGRVIIGGVWIWALLCASSMRPPAPTAAQFSYGVVDLRTLFTSARDLRGHRHSNPVTLEDHLASISREQLDPVPSRRGQVWAPWGMQGAISYGAGPNVYVLDDLGLGDWFTSRLPLTHNYPDHQKQLPLDWTTARLELITGIPTARAVPVIRAARHAFHCGALAELHRAVTEPLSASRFLENAVDAVRLHGFRVAQNPVAAERSLCGTGTSTR